MLAWALAGRLLPRRSPAAAPVALNEPPRLAWIALLCVTLVALPALGLRAAAFDALAHSFHGGSGAVPIVVRPDASAGNGGISDVELLAALAESACLLGLYRALRRCRVTGAVVAIVTTAFIGAAALAVSSPVANSSDLYGYVGFALEPATAYLPGNVPFTGAHAAVDAMVGDPRPATLYGPLWIAVSHLIVAPFAHLATQLYALRLLEILALVACIGALARIGTSFATLALLALNPGVLGLWVADGHNDLFGIAFVLLATAARRFALVRVALVVAAGLVKLPLVFVGALAFAGETSRRKRIALAFAAVALCIALSVAFGDGGRYFANLSSSAARQAAGGEVALHGAALALACAALGFALIARRYSPGLAWIWPALGAFPAPWYAIWGLPYAVASRTAVLFFIAQPIVGFLFSWTEAATPLVTVTSFCVLAGPLAYALAMRARERRGRSPHLESAPFDRLRVTRLTPRHPIACHPEPVEGRPRPIACHPEPVEGRFERVEAPKGGRA
jgi:hypothetical protein